MCVPLKKRTLRDEEYYDIIYQLIEDFGLCEYVKNPKFIKYMDGVMDPYRNLDTKNKEQVFRLAKGVDDFFCAVKWKEKIYELAAINFIYEFQKLGELDRYDPEMRICVTYDNLCYLLGMITFDYIELQKIH